MIRDQRYDTGTSANCECERFSHDVKILKFPQDFSSGYACSLACDRMPKNVGRQRILSVHITSDRETTKFDHDYTVNCHAGLKRACSYERQINEVARERSEHAVY